MSIWNHSIKNRLLSIYLVTILMALVLSGGAFIVQDVYSIKRTLTQKIAVQSKIIASNASVAIVFKDQASTSEILQALQADQEILSAKVFKEKVLFASYQRQQKVTPPSALLSLFLDPLIVIKNPVIFKNKEIAKIEIRSDYPTLHNHFIHYGLITGSVLFISFLISFIIATRMHRAFLIPLKQLVDITNKVAHDKDYTIKASKITNDEFGTLADHFNIMLEQINDRDNNLKTEVEKRTAELSHKEQRLRLYREQSPVALIEWNTRCQVVDWNKAAEKIFGYSLAEVKNQNLFDLMIPESEKKQTTEVWNHLISDMGGKTNINKNLTKDGGEITCEWFNTPLKDESGTVIGAASLVLDITERLRIDAVLQTLAETRGHDTKSIFQLIVQQLALSQGVRYALISQLNSKTTDMADTIAVWANGKIIDNFSYPLKGSPCEKVTMRGACMYADHVQELFPEDTLLVDMEAVCYFGILLKSINGTPLGILAMLDDKVADKQPSSTKLIESLAVRAATELERKQAEEKLQFAAQIYSDTHEGIILTDTNAVIVDVNPGFTSITGYSREEAIGQNANFISSGQHDESFYTQMWETLKKEGTWRGEIWNRRKSGTLYAELLTISALANDNNEVSNYVGLFSDITLTKKQQQSLESLAHYDMLTGLPNRTLFADRFSQAIAHSKREESMLAVCFIDLDEFKPVNDTYGHEIGDQVLIEVAVRIKENLRAQDTASRLGGDEFTLLLGDINSIEQCEQAMNRIHEAIAQPYLYNGVSITIAASSGMTVYPLDDADPDTLIRHADIAMYQAKLAGRNRYHLFDASEEQKIIKHHVQIKEIAAALSRNEFSLYYQPKLNFQSGEIYGAEALIRWIHPDKGLIPPLDFLPYIEGTELETQVGNWVVDEALKQLDLWRAQGINLQVSINISSLHLQWNGFLKHVESTLALYPKVNSSYLQLEILESSIISDVHSISQVIKELKNQLGVGIALDDFGTGYSSLTHLRRIPADTIKIDQSFVRDMLDDKNDYAIVEGITVLSKAFNRKVIAEGVETKEHGFKLIELGCMNAQGYGIARPMPAEELIPWLEEYQPYSEWISYAKEFK